MLINVGTVHGFLGDKRNMKIVKMIINNFRLLKNTEIELEEDLSLIIGKIIAAKHQYFLRFLSFLEIRNPQLVFVMMTLILTFKKNYLNV